MNKPLWLGCSLLLVLVSVPSLTQESDALDLWRDTLTFGIDSELTDLLSQLRDAQVVSLDDLIMRRFERTRSNALKVTIIEHFQQTESDVAVAVAEQMLLSEEQIPGDLLRVLIQYRVRFGGDASPDLTERYSTLAQDSGNQLAANAAIEALGEIGSQDAVRKLIELLDDLTSSELQGSVIRALGVAGDPSAVDRLSRISTDEFADASHRQYAAESLGRIGQPESIETLTALLSDSDSLLRAYATYALGFYSAEQTATLLEDALLDSFWRVRVAALQAIEEQGHEAARDAVAYKARRDPERPVREAALRTLGALGVGETDVLKDVALSDRVSIAERSIAIEELSERGASNAVEAFAEIISTEWERENSRALDMVGREISAHASREYVALYERLLTHPNFIMQIYAIRGIGNSGLRQFEDQLQSTAALTSPTALSRAARLALETMGIDFVPPGGPDEADAPDGDQPEDDLPTTGDEASGST